MRFRIRHITHYKYAQQVSRCYNLANVVPRDTDSQRAIKSRITVSPQAATTHKRTDYFGNIAYHFEIQRPHTELTITAETDIDIDSRDSELDLGASYGESLAYLRDTLTPETIAAREFLLNSQMIEPSRAMAEYAKPSFNLNRSLKSCVSELTTRIFNDFEYDPGFSTIATPLAEVLEHKRGVCQDFAHLQIGCLRSMGIPAKYVSGYIETLPKPGEVKLVGADATHAWVAYFCPKEGWVEFDPTNNTAAGSQHIVTAFGRDYGDVTPIKGVIFGGGKSPVLSVSVDVRRL
ncbi:transglutaminase family protein [Oceanicoccus sp. KOV_DT_Chl]|uniref:transglutaminase family protein n=1 Tax=Oceanicoccus sp. KOV_DT_Chl TaxID=1904639 RepID=UPI000C7E4ACC|nr:transglutaminase family protein [Oceanicoccus sp. KOV_DT_Chl]